MEHGQKHLFCSPHEGATSPERTVRVVGVGVGVGGVPALNGPIDPPAETLLTIGAHGDAQHSSTRGKKSDLKSFSPAIDQTLKNSFLLRKITEITHFICSFREKRKFPRDCTLAPPP